MTDTMDATSSTGTPGGPELQRLVGELMARVEAEGVSLVGPGGLLAGLTKTVLESALEAEMTEHVGLCGYPHRPTYADVATMPTPGRGGLRKAEPWWPFVR
jgi:hypothetical protein